VSFYNGTTLLGTGTLTNGVATYTTTTLPLGSDTLQAAYAGAAYYLAAGPATLAQTVEEPPTATATSPALVFNPAAAAISAASAQTLTASFTVTNFGQLYAHGDPALRPRLHARRDRLHWRGP